MTAMILAAGRGERMRPLTDRTPKPLLEAQGRPLIVHQIERLAAAGFERIVINIAHLGYMIPEALGDGTKWGVKLLYSDEQQEGALESAGGIVKALPLLESGMFLVTNGDVWTDYPFNFNVDLGDTLAHLILVPNPDHNPDGDFALENGIVRNVGAEKFTFSGIGYYSAKLFKHLPYGKRPLGQLLREHLDDGRISGELFTGTWRDIGTPERLNDLNVFKPQTA